MKSVQVYEGDGVKPPKPPPPGSYRYIVGVTFANGIRSYGVLATCPEGFMICSPDVRPQAYPVDEAERLWKLMSTRVKWNGNVMTDVRMEPV